MNTLNIRGSANDHNGSNHNGHRKNSQKSANQLNLHNSNDKTNNNKRNKRSTDNNSKQDQHHQFISSELFDQIIVRHPMIMQVATKIAKDYEKKQLIKSLQFQRTWNIVEIKLLDIVNNTCEFVHHVGKC